MILQSNPKLLPILNDLGCYTLCLAEIASREYGYEYTPEQVNAVWEMAVKHGYVKDNMITSPDSMLKIFKELAKLNGNRIFQIGQTLNGFTEWWKWAGKYIDNKKYTVAMERTSGKYGTHFILVESYQNPVIVYDSWNIQRIGEKTMAQRYIYYAVI